ncbi:putative carboxypeptidase S1 [Lophium mytilinum]|uniref:Putative carboxypeptidase S1 n=1 Tax=Lophium mytilinum TaxID=390894 RepID=A0A6A6QEV3_9PEZI|nr:putative carboxypeptidase S1 [Lophium mytilinum]
MLRPTGKKEAHGLLSGGFLFSPNNRIKHSTSSRRPLITLRAFVLCCLLVLATTYVPLSSAAFKKDEWHRVKGDDVTYQYFEHAATGVKLKVEKNSGICEETPGVNHYPGYASFNEDEHMYFWFVEGRNSPTIAPFAINLAGGPGGASMAELTPTSSNTYNLNHTVNMIYIDQPIEAGFSYGLNVVGSTDAAAPYVWNLLQAFFAGFDEYENQDLSIITSSYGGHYGAVFADKIQQQIKKIDSGSGNSKRIEIATLVLGNGWYDGAIQYKAIIEYSRNNTYRPLISKLKAEEYLREYYLHCLPAQRLCDDDLGNFKKCEDVYWKCGIKRSLLSNRDFYVYDIRQSDEDGRPDVMQAIGAKSSWEYSSDRVYKRFGLYSDSSHSALDAFSKVVRSGVTTLSYAGDADMVDDWFGNLDVADDIDYDGTSSFASKRLVPYAVNGTVKGEFKTFQNLSFLRVYDAGHAARHDQPALAFQAFNQTMRKKAISPT